jgi:glutathione peroxidase
MSIYDLSFTDNSGQTIEMSQFKDNVLLLVNTASRCGFTEQYKGLQDLHKKYADRGLVVIGFPCNQFNQQEPGSDSEIKEFCQTNYGVDFLMSVKIDVNGENAHPIYKYLLDQVDFDTVPWNFTKFIVADEVMSMSPDETPESADNIILELLNKTKS